MKPESSSLVNSGLSIQEPSSAGILVPVSSVPMENHSEDVEMEPETFDQEPAPPPESNSFGGEQPPETETLKRCQRKKKWLRMPNNLVRGLRRKSRSGFYSEKIMDDLIQMQINDIESKMKRRRCNNLDKGVEMESRIGSAVGFPTDSLTEEEIDAGVVAMVGGIEQANYIIIRNHILSRWRGNVNVWLMEDHAMEAIRKEHRPLVKSAYKFLLHYGYINFGIPRQVQEDAIRGNVLIVGAGLAGLAAAKHLQFLGFKVVVIEGRNRAGGRVFTKKMCGDGVVAAADLGGSVLTGISGNPFGVMARQLGFPLHKVRDECPLYGPDGKLVNKEVDSKVEQLFNKLLDKVCKLRQAMSEIALDVSLGTALETFRKKVYGFGNESEEMMLFNWHLANLEYANAGLLSNLSLAFWDQDDPYEMGGDHCFIPGGNERFVRVLAENLPVFYGKSVEKIMYGVDGVLVFAGNQVFRGDMVLCTVPLGVLKKDIIKFEPGLPKRKKDAIERLGFGLLNKVAMLFPHVFWGRDIDTFGHLTRDTAERGEFFLFYSYASVSGGPLLVALVAGESAIKFEELSPSDLVDRVLEILRGIFCPKGIIVPNPITAVCTRWGKDKFTYGSYSHVAVGSSGDDYDILAENVADGRVFFAGEATNRRYPATMHGALLSGLREAANISRAAAWRGLDVQAAEFMQNGLDELVLDDLFADADFKFGSFSALFDPKSDDPDSKSLLRLSVKEKHFREDHRSGGGESLTEPMLLYSLVSRKQAMELSEVEVDEDRLKKLCHVFSANLVGSKGLGPEAGDLLTAVRCARSKPTTIGEAC